MRHFLLVMGLLISQAVYGQTISKSDLVNTRWFVNNLNGDFMSADTLEFIQYTNKDIDNKYNDYKEHEYYYLGHGDFAVLEFRRGGKLNFHLRQNNSTQVFDLENYYTWKFDKKRNLLILYKSEEVMLELKPFEKYRIDLVTDVTDDRGFSETNEIVFIREN